MYQIYQIMPGEDLQIIANKFNTTEENLVNINGLMMPYMLQPGNYLVVPKTNNNELFYEYTVIKGDNLYSIAGRYQTDVDTLQKLNGLEDNAYLYPNQKLLIPKENIGVYITEEESLEDISNKSGIDFNTLWQQNKKIQVMPDQVIVYKL